MSLLINNRNKAEIYDDLVIYYVKPKYKVSSSLSTILNLQYFKDNTILLIAEYDDKEYLEISARDQRCIIKLNELLRECIKDSDGSSAGGHIPAAGARIKKKDLGIFKKRLIDNYKSYKNK